MCGLSGHLGAFPCQSWQLDPDAFTHLSGAASFWIAHVALKAGFSLDLCYTLVFGTLVFVLGICELCYTNTKKTQWSLRIQFEKCLVVWKPLKGTVEQFHLTLSIRLWSLNQMGSQLGSNKVLLWLITYLYLVGYKLWRSERYKSYTELPLISLPVDMTLITLIIRLSVSLQPRLLNLLFGKRKNSAALNHQDINTLSQNIQEQELMSEGHRLAVLDVWW